MPIALLLAMIDVKFPQSRCWASINLREEFWNLIRSEAKDFEAFRFRCPHHVCRSLAFFLFPHSATISGWLMVFLLLAVTFKLRENNYLKLNRQLSFQDDITSTDESCCDESSNDENFLIPNQQSHQKIVQQPAPLPIVMQQRSFDDETKHQLFIQTQNQKINEKMLDNQKLLLESLSSLPQNLLQSWIQSGQLQVSVDDGENIFYSRCRWNSSNSLFPYTRADGMQSITIPFAIQKENSTQEIITKKIPIKLLTGKIKTEAEWDSLPAASVVLIQLEWSFRLTEFMFPRITFYFTKRWVESNEDSNSAGCTLNYFYWFNLICDATKTIWRTFSQ